MSNAPPPKERITLQDDLKALMFIGPFAAVFGLFIFVPLVYSIYISMRRGSIYSDFYNVFGEMQFVGIRNFADVANDPYFWWSVMLTFIYAALTIVPGMALSLGLALFLNRKSRGFGLLRSGFFLPNVFDVYVVGVIWLLIFNPGSGPVASLFNMLGATDLAKTGLLNTPWFTLPAIAIAMILKNAGFGMILFLTSLNNMNESIFEAADVDGASKWQKIWLITIPLLKPIILFLSVTGLVGTLNAFSEVYAMTDNQGGVSMNVPWSETTFHSARISGYHLFRIFDEARYGEAAAVSFMLLIIAVVISIINFKFLSPKD